MLKIPQLLAERASLDKLRARMRALELPKNPNQEQWLSAVGEITALSGSELNWLEPWVRRWFQSWMRSFVEKALTERWPEDGIPAKTLEDTLGRFVHWLGARPDRDVLPFCWEVMAFQDRLRYPSHGPVFALKYDGRLSGDIEYQSLALAIGLAKEADAMRGWRDGRWAVTGWSLASRPYLPLLGHGSYVVRAAAAHALGAVFYGCHTNECLDRPPAVAEMLAMIQQREVETPGIAGPFLCGGHWWIDDWTPFDEGFDFRSWFLDTLRQSGRELHVPHMQSLEFYAHEYFARDGSAIEEMLAMGRDYLAVMTATERPEAIPEIRPVLDRMANSSKPRVAAAIREYLAEPFHHTGLQHFNDEE